MTIAGSDSSGGAGIQADLKTFAALRVYGTSAITAITAQNTKGVDKVQILLPDMIEAQVQAVVSDMFVRSTKVGMLGSFENVALVARMIDERMIEKVIVDPVMVSTSGDRLMNLGVDKSYVELLLPRTFILTPISPKRRS
ncbi:phosphomethylpyrimidine kinase [mine drainage metagenome]|uniref:Phosphomethylpyrimidine kinase n=1 Tax=mine drainage metagenome TaxID=410659 RepID=T0ZTU7_9ZZZZ